MAADGPETQRAFRGSAHPSPTARRALWLLRHAKSGWSDSSLADRERPLAPRGQHAAKAMARELAAHRDGIPSLILCSPARRTVETMQALRPHLGPHSTVRTEEPLYLAGAAALAERLRAIPDEQAGVLLIGHDPGLHDLALALARPDESRAYRQLREKLPTGALVELELRLDSWRDLAPGVARLVAFIRPRDLA